MTSRSPRKSPSKSSAFTISLILGLLLIPLSAVAAAALISSDDGSGSAAVEPAVVVAEVQETTVTTTETADAETVFVTEAPTATAVDLEAACGSDGLELVEREAAGTITDLEQAALDALRQICAAEGLELAGPPAPPAVVRTVAVVSPTPSSTTAAAPSGEQATTVGDDRSEGDGEGSFEGDHEEATHHEDSRDDEGAGQEEGD